MKIELADSIEEVDEKNFRTWESSTCEYPNDLREAVCFGWSDMTRIMSDVVPVKVYKDGVHNKPIVMAIDIWLIPPVVNGEYDIVEE